MSHNRFNSILTVFLSVVLSVGLLGSLPVTAANTAVSDNTKVSSVVSDTSSKDQMGITYAQYRQKHADSAYPDTPVLVDVINGVGGKQVMVTDKSGDREGLLTTDEGTATFTVTVPEAGWYQMRVEYNTSETGSMQIEREIRIDGTLPFAESENIALLSVWTNEPVKKNTAGRSLRQDKQGNELLPEQIQQAGWITADIRSASGYIEEPLYYYFSSGEHTISFVSSRETVILGSLVLYQCPKIPTYKEYIAQHSHASKVEDYSFTLQGEDYARKSASEILPIADRASSAVQPNDPAYIRLNTVGGSGWGANGAWIEWDIQVPKDGLYRIALKYRQNFLSGMTANRKLLLDGKLPFKEAAYNTFRYNNNWKNTVLGSDEGEYFFYLTAGTTHTIRLECGLGESTALLQTAQQIANDLSSDYRKLVMYMGSAPDPNRDYKVSAMLPEVLTSFETNHDRLAQLSKDLIAFSGGRGSANAEIDNLYDCLRRMLKDTRDIPAMLTTFRDYVSALSTWVQRQSSQYLQIDYLMILGATNKMPKATGGFFQELQFGIRSFGASFVQDYSLMTSDGIEATIEVWVNTGRDQTQIIKELINNRFTAKTGIGVKLKLVTGQLLLATVAGYGPDVALMNTSGDVMNYALRSALVDLTQFQGFQDVSSRFAKSAMTMVTWDGAVYALPETQAFPVLFCRTDVLQELGLQVPQTWEELYHVIGELQKNNLQFGLPANINSYGLLLYQNGGQFYKDDGSASALTSKVAVESFTNWTQLYTNYSLPVEYDAATRFRSGEMPLLIADYTLYNSLTVSAPEIKGKWNFTLVPGVKQKDGSINRSVISGVIGSVMMSGSSDYASSWRFLQWWSDGETQTRYGQTLESILGTAARYASANREVAAQLPWKMSEYRTLTQQWDFAIGVPEIPGSYYTSRHIENAFRRVFNYGESERETLETYAETIDTEIAYKRKELKLD